MINTNKETIDSLKKKDNFKKKLEAKKEKNWLAKIDIKEERTPMNYKSWLTYSKLNSLVDQKKKDSHCLHAK